MILILAKCGIALISIYRVTSCKIELVFGIPYSVLLIPSHCRCLSPLFVERSSFLIFCQIIIIVVVLCQKVNKYYSHCCRVFSSVA